MWKPLAKDVNSFIHEHLDKTSLEYQTWKADHTKCKANFQGSAPAMEPEGADRIFRRSVERHNLRYTEFYGDGDSKSYKELLHTHQMNSSLHMQASWSASMI